MSADGVEELDWPSQSNFSKYSTVVFIGKRKTLLSSPKCLKRKVEVVREPAASIKLTPKELKKFSPTGCAI